MSDRTRTRNRPTLSYKDCTPSSPASSLFGRSNRAENTRPELRLRRELWRQGFRYRLHDKRLPGKPDIVLRRYNVVIFCDGDLWHGRDWQRRKDKLKKGANASYWIAKIQRNMERDREVNCELRKLGWRILRVWEGDINNHLDEVAKEIRDIITSGIVDVSIPLSFESTDRGRGPRPGPG